MKDASCGVGTFGLSSLFPRHSAALRAALFQSVRSVETCHSERALRMFRYFIFPLLVMGEREEGSKAGRGLPLLGNGGGWEKGYSRRCGDEGVPML